jgi:hypothetical protein
VHKTIRRSVVAVATAAFVLVAGVSCDSPTALKSGKLSLLLTDAPGDVVKAVVTIDQIYLQASADSANPSGRIILRDADVTTDLLTLVDSTQSLIADVVIPAGSYSQLRFVISGAYIEVEGDVAGTTTIFASSSTYAGLPTGSVVGGDLQMPSFAQSGLKVQLPGDALVIGDDASVTLVVDFDVAQSFGKAAGSSGRWVMSPVLRGMAPTPTPAP